MNNIVYKIVKFIGKPLFCLICKPTFKGLENIPQNGSAILAGNHTHILDAAIVVSSLKREIHMMAKQELFNSRLSRWFFRSMGCISVNRSIHDKKAKYSAIDVLNNGGLIGIFPEGTVNKTDDKILPFKYGAVSIASKSNTYIVPFSITGRYFKRNVTITFGKAYKVSDDLEKENNKLEGIVIKLLKENKK